MCLLQTGIEHRVFRMLRLLWASPLPPTRSGVSDYAVELLPALAERATVRVVVPPELGTGERASKEAVAELQEDLGTRIELVGSEVKPGPGELQLVHLGNNPYHEWLIPRLELEPTVVVIHDLVLHHLLVESTVARGRHDEYARRLQAACGSPGAALAEARRHGLWGRRDPFLFPATRAFLESASGVIVHSRWAADEVRRVVPGIPVAAVGLAARDPGPVDRHRARQELGLREDEVVLMHLGFMTREKGLLEILAAVAAAVAAGLAVRLVLVGEGCLDASIRDAVDRLGLGGRVVLTGWVEPEVMRRLPAAADLGVVVRRPSAGETSAAALRFLSCGTPVAVVGLRQFLEWPEPAAPRLTPGPGAAAELARLLVEVAESPDWSERRQAARAAYEVAHRPEQAASAMVEVLNRLVQGR